MEYEDYDLDSEKSKESIKEMLQSDKELIAAMKLREDQQTETKS